MIYFTGAHCTGVKLRRRFEKRGSSIRKSRWSRPSSRFFMKLFYRHFFDASHQLPDSDFLITKKCANLHGHTYAVDVEIETEELNAGMIIDFSAVKQTVDILDHQHINTVFSQHGYHVPSTAENIALFLKKNIEFLFTKKVSVGIRLNEGYKGENRGGWIEV